LKREKLTIEYMQKIAQERGGLCLSETYVNARTKLLWICSEGHRWEAEPWSVKTGRWCRICSRRKTADSLKATIEDMIKLASERGGKCLSNEYKNARSKLLWECAEGHRWETTPSAITTGRWCHECSSGLGERICRCFFEQLFNTKFPKSLPEWLINEDGNRMELDGFNEELKIAFEHQGSQHYTEETHYFLKSHKEIYKRRRDDETKRLLCAEHGISLIEVPEIPKKLKLYDVKDYIKNEFIKANVNLPANWNNIQVKLVDAYSPSYVDMLRELAHSYGGKYLDEHYLGMRHPARWQCEVGHEWSATPDNIQRGHWCGKCARKRIAEIQRSSIDEMRAVAKERGGHCLSKKYVNAAAKLVWSCKYGHTWETTPGNVKRGHWCKKCAGLEVDTIENMRSIAEQRKGSCVSESYTNANTKLEWICQHGHSWFATPDKVKRGSWCPECAKKNEKTITK